jgi:hypothetical protein
VTDTRSAGDADTTKENALLTHDLIRLRDELDSPRLSALHSTLGLAVARAALRALGSGTAGAAPPSTAELPAPDRRVAPAA